MHLPAADAVHGTSEAGDDLPQSDIDPFASEFLANPYPGHEALREAGPLVKLSRYGCLTVARHDLVKTVLADPGTFGSSRGVGLVDYATTGRFRPPSLLLEADPPAHGKARSIMGKVLSPSVMRALKERFAEKAHQLVGALLQEQTIDGVRQLAEAFPLSVFPDAVGLPPEGRENLLPIGDVIFNSFGPENELFLRSKPVADQGFQWLDQQSLRQNLAPGGFGQELYAFADADQISENDAGVLVHALLQAGLDTTVSGIGALLHGLAACPEQWEALRAEPKLIRPAFEETIRHFSPVQTFFRTTMRPTELAGILIPEGTKILMMLAAANRDPRKWDDPDRFDIRRNAVGHVGFGAGIHMCVGQNLARLEAEALLIALLAKVQSIELAGEPEIRLNNTLRSFSKLPLKLIPH